MCTLGKNPHPPHDASRSSRRDRLAHELLNLSTAVAVLAGLVTALAFAGALHPLLDWLVHFRAIYAAAGLLALPALAANRRGLTLVAAAVVAVNLGFMAPYAPMPLAERVGYGTTFEVMAVNAYGNHSDHDELIARIRRDKPDILFVSELRHALKDRLVREFPHHVWKPEPYQQFGLFSTFPIEGGEYILAPNGRPTINAVVSTPVGRIRVLGAHPTAPAGVSESHNRNVMLAQIAHAAGSSDEPVVVLGDLNVTMFSSHYAPLERAGLTNARVGRGLRPTWPDWSPVRIPIDHILVSHELEVCDTTVGETFGSDHLPLRATVSSRSQR
jgi:endonuclease/exonuclease/phosphatase (EEP) superfamily protein YafD